MSGGGLPLKSSFPAVIDTRTRVMILGSLPGDMSLARREYYANPSNQFWRLTGAVIGCELAALPYDERLSALLDAGIGLWDVVATARRSGSGDSAIAHASTNRLADLAASHPGLRALAFNGGRAAFLGRRELRGTQGPALIDLPSSSAAHCRVSIEAKLDRWRAVARYL